MIEKKNLRLAFQAENAPSGEKLRERLPSFIERLEEMGFRVPEATCEVRDPDSLRQGLVHELAGLGAYAFRAVA
jgi:hypothetical protein